MKKTLLTAALLSALFTMAQQTENNLHDAVAWEIAGKPIKPLADNSKALPFWTEDFGNGFPASWAVVDSSGICPWRYSVDGSWGYYNGNQGTAGGDVINSTSSLNGFLICDPDSANHFTYGQPSGTTYQYLSSYFITSAIDCSGKSSVILSFEQLYRYNNGVAMNVLVSNDSLNWTGFDVSDNLANNTISSNPDLVNINITNIAANQPTVYIKVGWSARVYYWMLDDISLREADPNDVVMEDSWWGTGIYQYQYYKIPLSQSSPVTFNSEISNNTGNNLTGVYSDITVTNGAGVDFNGTSAQAALAAVEMDTFVVTGWTPGTADVHSIDFTAIVNGQTDGDPTNNVFSDELEITTSLYGLDNLQNASQSTSSISNFSGNTGQPFRIGNIYEIINDDGIQCIQIGIADVSQNDGGAVYGEVHVWNETAGAWEVRGVTDVLDLTAADLGTIVNLPLISEAPVYAGEEALVVAGHYGGAGDGSNDVRFMYGQPVQNQMVYGFDALGDAYWLSNPRAIVVRPDFNCGLSIQEQGAEMATDIYPNPATDVLNLKFGKPILLEKVEIYDNAGKELHGFDSLPKDYKSTLQLNTHGLLNGVYQVRIVTATDVIVKKMVIRR